MEKPKLTAGDIGWFLLYMVVMLPLTFGSMFAIGAYVTPLVLGSPNSSQRHGIEIFVEVGLILGGMILGMLVTIIVFSFFTRRFLSKESHRRWTHQFENDKSVYPSLIKAFGMTLLKYMQPRKHKNVL